MHYHTECSRDGSDARLLCSVCIPVYNEAECLHIFLADLLATIASYQKVKDIDFEVIAVDDGSRDQSLEILKHYSDLDKSFRVFAFEQNSGHQAAILCCLNHADGDIIITMDSDGQDPPESIPALVDTFIESKNEIVIAKRRSRKDGLVKKVTAWLFYRLLTILGLPSESRDSGDYRLISRRIKNLILAQPNSLQYIRGQIFTLKAPTRFICIDRKERIAGRTKYTLSKMIKLAISSAYVIDPLKVAQVYIIMAAFFLVISGAIAVAFIGTKIMVPTYYASGITTLVILLLFLFSVVISMIAFQSLYISMLFRSLRNEPAYLEKKVQ